jgi:prevent-host-death family protein
MPEVRTMTTSPLVVSVSDLRRRLATVIDEVNRYRRPLFVTQYGLVTAVLVSAEEHAASRPGTRIEPNDGRRAAVYPPPALAPSPSHRSPRLTPLPTRRVWTKYGLCDFETAQVLAAQGVDTELVFTEEGWLPDDEG